jgi:hypothetical protein
VPAADFQKNLKRLGVAAPEPDVQQGQSFRFAGKKGLRVIPQARRGRE